MNKDKILELVSLLETDCQAQVDSLTHGQDVSWDCYNIESWESMLFSLLKIRKEVAND